MSKAAVFGLILAFTVLRVNSRYIYELKQGSPNSLAHLLELEGVPTEIWVKFKVKRVDNFNGFGPHNHNQGHDETGPSDETPVNPEEETPEEEAPKDETPEGTMPEEEPPQEEIPDEETPEAESPEGRNPETEIPEEGVPEEELPEEETPEADEPQDESPHEEIPQEENPENQNHVHVRPIPMSILKPIKTRDINERHCVNK